MITKTPYELMIVLYGSDDMKVLAQESLNLGKETVMPTGSLLHQFVDDLWKHGYSGVKCLPFAMQAINQYALEQLARK